MPSASPRCLPLAPNPTGLCMVGAFLLSHPKIAGGNCHFFGVHCFNSLIVGSKETKSLFGLASLLPALLLLLESLEPTLWGSFLSSLPQSHSQEDLSFGTKLSIRA